MPCLAFHFYCGLSTLNSSFHTMHIASITTIDYLGVGDTLGLLATILCLLILLCNLGSRAWNKLEIGCVDSSSTLSLLVVIGASLISGLVFPYIALNNVHGGTDGNDEEVALEKVLFNSNGKRARQNITFASCTIGGIFLLSDIKPVQDALGFNFGRHRGVINLIIGVWWFLSTMASLMMCRPLDNSKSTKIQPFLKKDETSLVGFIVPSVPNIVIDPCLSGRKMIFPSLGYGSGLICVGAVAGLTFYMVWTGVREM